MNRKTILLVDDEENIRNALTRVLKSEGYHILGAKSGAEALRILAEEQVHVILSDLGMPEMDGVTLLKKVARNYPDTVRLVVSAYADAQNILAAVNTGEIYRYIVKPWNDLELRISVRQAIAFQNLKAEKQHLLDQLRESNCLLEQKVEQRTHQLVASMNMALLGNNTTQIVHNLNNTLSNIWGLFYRLNEELFTEEFTKEDMMNLCKDGLMCAEKMHEIVSGILNYARNEKQFKTEPVDINTIVTEEERFFTMNQTYKYGIKRSLALTPSLPKVVGNVIQIRQILDNVIKNAIDAMENSSQKELTFQTYARDNDVVIKISDTGEGIAEGNLHKIFDAQYTTKALGKGTGLGLASAKSMVEAYGGRLEVSSKLGVGTSFEISLPCVITSNSNE